MPKRIIYTTASGSISIVVPAPGVSIEDCMRCVPLTDTIMAAGGVPVTVQTNPEIVDTWQISSDRTFRNAWKRCPDKKIDVCMSKAKAISHEKRRIKRAQEFAPHDEVIAKQIPGKSAADAEKERQKIRIKHDAIQADIDAATTPDQLRAIIAANSL